MVRNQLSLNAPMLPTANAPGDSYGQTPGAANGAENIAHALPAAGADEDRALMRTGNLGPLWQRR